MYLDTTNPGEAHPQEISTLGQRGDYCHGVCESVDTRACSRIHTCLFKRLRHTSATFSCSCTATPTWTVLRVSQHRWPRVAPGHPREGGEEEGVRRQVPKVGVFPPMLCYMANTPAVRRNPVRLFSRGPKWKRTAVTVPPSTQTKRRGGGRGKKYTGIINCSVAGYSWRLSSYSQFPVAVPPSVPALTCTPRGTSP